MKVAMAVLGSFLLASSALADSVPAPPAASHLLEAVQHGKAVSLDALFRDEKAFYYVMDRIAEGTATWLDVAVHLAPGADAHPGEELANALALALPNAAEAVLTRSFKPISLDDICSGPGLLEDSAKYRDVVEHSMTAVSSIKNSKLKSRRDRCLKVLRDTLAQLSTEENSAK